MYIKLKNIDLNITALSLSCTQLDFKHKLSIPVYFLQWCQYPLPASIPSPPSWLQTPDEQSQLSAATIFNWLQTFEICLCTLRVQLASDNYTLL